MKRQKPMRNFLRLFEHVFAQFILDNYEFVLITGPTGEKRVKAKIDTGANRTSVDMAIAEEIGLLQPDNIIELRQFSSGLGQEQRKVVHCQITIKNRMHKTQVSISDRKHMRHKVIVGRQDIKDFFVRPSNQEEK